MEGQGPDDDPAHRVKTKAYIDRIEDGKTAVVVVAKYGELLIPVKDFRFEIREGMHLSLDLAPDPASESETFHAVQDLQKKLLKESGGR